MTVLAILTAFALAAGLTRYLSDPDARLMILDHPNERSVHSRPTPRTGGIAVAMGAIAGGTVLPIAYPYGHEFLVLFASATPLIVVSLVDDRFGVSPAIRLLVHFLSAGLLAWTGFIPTIIQMPGLTWAPPPTITILLGLCFVVWMINLYNFMDGMDGFAGGMAVIGFSTLAVLGLQNGDELFAGASLLIAASAAGFLVFNFPPAKIFLGDTGSSLLGFMVAGFSLWGSAKGLFPLWIPMLTFSPFIVDASITLIRRLLQGEKVWRPHLNHYYQRAIRIGLKHRRIVLAEYVLMLACAASAVLALRLSGTEQLLLLASWALVYGLLHLLIARLERRGVRDGRVLKGLNYRFRHRHTAMAHDLLMVPVAWLGAYWLRFNLEPIPEAFLDRALALLPVVVVVHGAMFLHFGLYRGIWRFASMPDFIRILKSVLAAVAVFSVLILLITRMEHVPRSIFVLHSLLLLVLLGFPRFTYRWLKDHSLYYKPNQRVLIVGAGRAGEVLARDLVGNPDGEYQPVVFVDDDPRKKGTEVRGLRVAARCRRIPRVVKSYEIDLILIAIPSASSEQMRRIVGYCEASGRPFRTLPSVQDLLSGRATLRELREVSIEDLLGRAPVSLDWETIRRKLSGRRVLISGGGGSIGSELCRQVATLQPAAVTILERSEINLHRIALELRDRFPQLTLNAHLGDVGDAVFVNHLMRIHRPEVVFHAAAHKQVPLLELHAREAIRNNLFGTVVLSRAADRHGCGTFVLISTDKAVRPANILGISKHLAEAYCQSFNRCSNTRFVIVRFGNVLDSAGSVVPLFRQQIKAGGPVTVTDPRVSRFFMTIPEASQLIMQAGAVGNGGEIYVLDMGDPVKINYLAEQMIRLSGKEPGKDIAIEYIGLRSGEKLHEELFHDSEDLMPTPYPKLLLAQHRPIEPGRVFAALHDLRQICETYDEDRLRARARRLIVELQGSENREDKDPERAAGEPLPKSLQIVTAPQSSASSS